MADAAVEGEWMLPLRLDAPCVTIITIATGGRVAFAEIVEQIAAAAIVHFGIAAHHVDTRLLQPLVALMGGGGGERKLGGVLRLNQQGDQRIGLNSDQAETLQT